MKAYIGRLWQRFRESPVYAALANERGNVRVIDTRTGQITTIEAKDPKDTKYIGKVIIGKEYITAKDEFGIIVIIIPREYARIETDGSGYDNNVIKREDIP